MFSPVGAFLSEMARELGLNARQGWRALIAQGSGQIRFWIIALVIGIVVGAVAIGFRIGIERLQSFLYRSDDLSRLTSALHVLPWPLVIGIPVLGGLTVGLILNAYTDDGRVRSVGDTIAGAALHDGRVELREGFASAAASFITLSTGGSTGREGPVVHLASVISTLVARRMKADGITGRDLMGCAVAAAVSASFNAPIAGAVFALEVVLRHLAINAFAPIAIASVVATVLSRLVYGDVTEFALPASTSLEFYIELPAFLLLGIVCGVVATVLIRAVLFADSIGTSLQNRLSLHRALRPAVAGLLLGLLALGFPAIIGVGYETTNRALTGDLLLREAFVLVVMKVIAVAITMGGRMGGGIFSPSLMIGALTGLAFGIVATAMFPDQSGEGTLYALAGMGAVSGAVLGAPISTTLIVFELTGNWQTGIAVILSVSLASALSSRLVGKSFFLVQQERRGIHLAAGPQAYLLSTFRVETVMRAAEAPRAAPEETAREMIAGGTYLIAGQTLEMAMPIFETAGASFIPVIEPASDGAPPLLIGAVFQVDALRAFNRALAAAAREEHS